ncbi:hypothetical protein AB0G74_33500 [Streptomyces sp. NPDC020875]|uniref:hypothetical protein n=1 Tax=Streptomyces sp. NPDC020875 TaxID=3154898 RepID=UPI0033C40B3F
MESQRRAGGPGEHGNHGEHGNRKNHGDHGPHGERREGAAAGPGTGDDGGEVLAEDRRWTHDLWAAAFCALALLVLLHIVDLGGGTLDAPRSALWCGLAALLFAVLYPPRVTVGHDWLRVRGLVREHRVRTDLLTRIARRGGIAQRVVLRDAEGHRAEVDPLTLYLNPLIRHELERGARRSRESGLLRTGTLELDGLCAGMADADTDAARAVFDASGLR